MVTSGTSFQTRANVGWEVRGTASRLPPIYISQVLTSVFFTLAKCLASIRIWSTCLYREYLTLLPLGIASSAVILGTRLRLAGGSDGHRNCLPEIRSRVRRPKLHPEIKADLNHQTRRILHSRVSEKKVGEALHHTIER